MNTIFLAFGVLPQKSDKGMTVLDESQKKTFQKRLQRLAKEDLDIQNQLNEMISLLSDIINESFNHEPLGVLTYQLIHDIFDEYKSTTTFFTTFLNKKDNVEWLLFYRSLPIILTSVFCHAARFRLNALSQHLPHPTVFLPQYRNAKNTTALSHIWDWIYKDCGLSQRQFHCKTKNNYETTYTRNLENAQGWCAGRALPSLHALYNNLETSLDQHNTFSLPADKMRLNGYKTALLIARISTYAFNSLENSYGQKKAKELSEHAQQQIITASHIGKYSSVLAQIFIEHNKTYTDNDKIYLSSDFINKLYDLKGDILHQTNPYNDEQLNDLYLNLGQNWSRFTSAHNEREKAAAFDERLPKHYLTMHDLGISLKKNSRCTFAEIIDYEKQLASFGLQAHLSWLSNWCKAVFYYRKQDNASAFTYYEIAFEDAKYKIGGIHYNLVNQYVESAAKMKNWKAFKKGAAWACYLGLEIRFYRGFVKELDQETALKKTFKLLGMDKLRYPIV